MSPRRHRAAARVDFVTVITVITLATLPLPRALASPSPQRAVPAAAQPGTVTRVVFHGKNLESATRLWTSFPAQTKHLSNENSSEKSEFEFSLASDCPYALGAVRLYGSNGVSSPLLFLIDDLPSIPESNGHHSRQSPQTLILPAAVDGVSPSLGFSYYSLKVSAGQHLVLDILAQRLGSRMDPVVRLLDADGRELAYVDDTPGLGPDCRFAHTFHSDGEFLVEIRDVQYNGGASHFYRLRLGAIPLATWPFPFAVPTGEPASVLLLGPQITASPASITVTVPDRTTGACVPVGDADRGPRAYTIVRASRHPQWIEVEPNETGDQAVSFTMPASLAGRLEADRDRDVYRFEGRKGARVIARAATRSAGFPCDLWMRFERPDGSLVAESKVQESDDGVIDHKLPADGSYHLVIEELNRQGAPHFAYGIDVAEFEPGFELSLETDHVEARAGAEFSLKIDVARQDYDGPIELEVEGLVDGAVLKDSTVPEKKTEATLKVTLPDTWAPEILEHFAVIGSATIADRPFRARASILPALKKSFPQTREFPPGLEDRIALWIAPP